MDQPTLDGERRYLDGLLNTRFNFYVLLMSALGAGLIAQPHLATTTAKCLLALGFLASLALTLMILRTAALLRVVLDMIVGIRGRDGTERARGEKLPDPSPDDPPYRVAFLMLGRSWAVTGVNAIRVIECAVCLTSLALFAAAALSLAGAFDPPPAMPGQAG